MKFLTLLKKSEIKFVEFITTKRRSDYWINRTKNILHNQKILSREQIKQIRNFYEPYTKVDMVFSEFYTQKTGLFFENYIPDNLYYCKIDPYFNDWKAASYLDNKCYYDKWYFKGENIPKTLACCINSYWMIPGEKGWEFITKEQVCDILMMQDCFIKEATLSLGGHGVRKIKKGISQEEIGKILSSFSKDVVVQEAIEQSSTISRLNPKSVNSVRVLSFLDRAGNVKIYSTIIRLGVGESVVDNASSGGITCGIESDGRLKTVAYSADGEKYDKHPTTGVNFEDVVIPNYDKVLTLVKKLHKNFPSFRLLSWDIAIDKNDEPIIIEVNLCNGELDFHQLNNGPVFGDDTKKILDEVFGSK